MGFTWVTKDSALPTASIYENNITLNKVTCKYFEEVNYVLLGYDNTKDQIAIKPVYKKDLKIYSNEQLHKIHIGKSYCRITNKSFIEQIKNKYHLDFNIKQYYKFTGEYDVIHSMLIINLKEE